jgi:hypothetical protein
MSTTVILDDQSARALELLREQANARGISLDHYLAELAANGQRSMGTAQASSPHDLTPAEFRQWLMDVSAGMPSLPAIPVDFSRADIYDDHD